VTAAVARKIWKRIFTDDFSHHVTSRMYAMMNSDLKIMVMPSDLPICLMILKRMLLFCKQNYYFSAWLYRWIID
jgi:hypothetical protein